MRHRKAAFFAMMILSLVACGGMTDDLRPSGADKRADAANTAPATTTDFTLSTIDGGAMNLASLLADHDAVVFYFTMWCPVCDSHMSHIRRSQAPLFPNVAFVLVDYVSNSVEQARMAARSAGFSGAPFTVVVDNDTIAQDIFQATMGTTVVVGPGMTILQNEDYKDGAKLRETLSGL